MKDFASKAVSLFLYDRQTVSHSNATIAARLAQDAPGYKVPASLLTAPFKAHDRAKVVALLQEQSVAIDLSKLNTPSKVKGALAALYRGEEAIERMKVEVSFTNSHVTVGNRAFPISREGGTPRIQVGKAKLNVASLMALLRS